MSGIISSRIIVCSAENRLKPRGKTVEIIIDSAGYFS